MNDIENLKKSVVLNLDEFFSRGKKSTLFEEVHAELIEESRKEIFDLEQVKRNKDWNELCNKVVGSE